MFEYMIKRAVYEDARDGKGLIGIIPYLVAATILISFGIFFVAPVLGIAIIAHPLIWAGTGERPSIRHWVGLTIVDLQFDPDTEFSMPGSVAITTFLFAFPLYAFIDGGLGPAALVFLIALAEIGLLAKGAEILVDDGWQTG
jgi:hypothetical protein